MTFNQWITVVGENKWYGEWNNINFDLARKTICGTWKLWTLYEGFNVGRK